MAYNFRRGVQFVGDISGSDDSDRNTGIDFEEDTISLVAGGTSRLKVTNNNTTSSVVFRAYDNLIVDGRIGIGTTSPGYKLEIGGNMAVGQYIYHRNDDDTLINFTDDRIRLKAGGMGMVGMHKKSSAPHQVTINNGNNNIDFHINSNNNANDPILMSDASAARIGIGTDSPNSKLHVSGTFSLPIAVIDGVSNAIGSSHHTVLLNADSGNCAAQLPAASGIAGRVYVFKRIDGSHNHVKVQSNGSEEIEGSTNDLDINNQYESFTLQCDGTRWWIISDNHV